MHRSVAISNSTMMSPTGVLGLEARGKNQLIKELNEIADTGQENDGGKFNKHRKIVFIREAIHRNEETGEVEPPGNVDEYIDIDMKGMWADSKDGK